MAPFLLPRVGKFPIAGEKSPLTVLGGSIYIPASEQHTSPLIGKPAPEFELPDHLGRRCALSAVVSLGRPIILFFFPLAGSPHCTKESCMFRDALGLTPVFSEMQAIVIGISQDPPERSKRFVDEHKLGYRILHDVNRSVMDSYGVGHILMGLIDQRCTFIIDPAGTVRAMTQGVFDAVGHVRFAERWLVRLENELSHRSRQVLKYQSKAGDLIVGKGEDDDTALRVLYGEANSASIGGIDSAPRFGAAMNSTSPPPALKKPRDRNIWRHWKAVFSHRIPQDRADTSFDDTASATEPVRRDSHGGLFTKNRGDSSSPPARRRFGLPRSRSTARLKELAQERTSDAQKISLEQARRNSNRDLPPLPASAAQEYALNNGIRAQGSEGSDRETSGWTTESSMSSHASTTATSMGSHAIRAGPVPSGLPGFAASPIVTSEVLMAAEAPVRRSTSGSVSGLTSKSSLRQAALLNGHNNSYERSDLAGTAARNSGLSASTSMPLSSDRILSPQHFADNAASSSSDHYGEDAHLTRHKQQAAETGDLMRSPSVRRRDGAGQGSLSQNGHESPAGRSDSPGSAQSHNTMRDAVLRSQNRSKEEAPIVRSGIYVPPAFTSDKLQRNGSLQSGRLSQNRHASITDGIYRIGHVSLDSDAPKVGQFSSDASVSHDTRGEEYYSALTPRSRPPRSLANGRTTPSTQHTRQSSGSMALSTDTTADGHTSTDTTTYRVRRKDVPAYSPNALLADLPVDVTDNDDDEVPTTVLNSPAAPTSISRALAEQTLEQRTPRADPASLPKNSASNADAVLLQRTEQPAIRSEITPSSSLQNVHTASYYSPLAASRTSSILSSPTATTDSSSGHRRPSYAESVCSMGTFGRRESSIYDSSATERGDDDDDENDAF